MSFYYFIQFNNYFNTFKYIQKIYGDWGLGIGDWGLGIGDWAQSPIPNPQSPIPIYFLNIFKHIKIIIKLDKIIKTH
jgi:hypothetical protein